jgi:hypothetical protein
VRDLRLQLDDTDFEHLFEIARSSIPTLAPQWTDHNVHDPGIMLLELTAWVAEAQIYSLGRNRRDERAAYAALLGVRPQGPTSAGGLVWPDDFAGTPPWPSGMMVTSATEVTADYPDAPTFRPSSPVVLMRAKLLKVETHFANGTVHDWTLVNGQPGSSFAPFGDDPAPGDALVLTIEGTLSGAVANADACITIGFDIEPPRLATGDTATEEAAAADARTGRSHARLRVGLDNGREERVLRSLRDTTDGLLHSGVLFLPVAVFGATGSRTTLAIDSASGPLLRAPHVRRIALNVLPVEQIEDLAEEDSAFGRGIPDQQYALQRDTLLQQDDAPPVTVTLIDAAGAASWSMTSELAKLGPHDRAFALDADAGVLQFGNGINGAMPAAGATLQVSYRVSQGSRGNLPSGVRWSVRGVPGEFGTNAAALSGGRDGEDLEALRRLSRGSVFESRPLVTARDLEDAARAMTDLGVTRAREWITQPSEGMQRGLRVLVVLGTSPSGPSAEWLEAIRSRLAPRLPLGQRLVTRAPRLVAIRIEARLVAEARIDPALVAERTATMLRKRLAIVPESADDTAWPFGRDVTTIGVKGWLRNVDGVAQVRSVQLYADGAPAKNRVVSLGALELPRLALAEGDIAVSRPQSGATA